MSVYEKLIDLGRRPSGLPGRLLGYLMNRGHREAHVWGIDHLSIEPGAIVLDVGCGGGAVVWFLAIKVADGKVYGIDHAEEMVALSKRVNRQFVKAGRVEIDHGSVSRLPYPNDMFDAVTAFETIEFWPHLNEDLQEVRRVLKPGGTLLIVNRHTPPGVENKYAEFLRFHSPDAYRDPLGDAGYVEVSIDDHSRAGWIAVDAKKPRG